MTDKEKSLRIEINNSIDKIVNGVVHPHTEREQLAQKIVKLFAIPVVSNSVCYAFDWCKIKTKKGNCRKNCKHYAIKQTDC